MMNKFFLSFMLIFSIVACASIDTTIEYKIKKIIPDKNYVYTNSYGKSSIKNDALKFYILLKFNENNEIKVNFWDILNREENLNVVLLDDVIILRENHNKIIIDKNEIGYTVRRAKHNKDRKILDINLKIPEKLVGKIKINFGKVRIGKKIFETPEIVMQRYKVSESNSLIETFLNLESQGRGEHTQFYHNEGWIEE